MTSQDIGVGDPPVLVGRVVKEVQESIEKVEKKLEGTWNASCEEVNNVILRFRKEDCPGARWKKETTKGREETAYCCLKVCS